MDKQKINEQRIGSFRDDNSATLTRARTVTLDSSVLNFYDYRNMEEKTAVTALGALAQPMRLRVFRALVGAGPPGLTPGALSATLGVPASTLSFHLKELLHSGLVSQERDGRHLIYRPSIDQMNALMAYLTAHCCQGAKAGACDIASPAGCSTC